MKGLDIHNCEMGTISSRADHSCKFSVITPELLASQAGALLGWHGKACRVTILPHEGEPDEVVTIETEKGTKTPSQQLRGVLYRVWEHEGKNGDFNLDYYPRQMAKLVEHFKAKLPV